MDSIAIIISIVALIFSVPSGVSQMWDLSVRWRENREKRKREKIIKKNGDAWSDNRRVEINKYKPDFFPLETKKRTNILTKIMTHIFHIKRKQVNTF